MQSTNFDIYFCSYRIGKQKLVTFWKHRVSCSTPWEQLVWCARKKLQNSRQNESPKPNRPHQTSDSEVESMHLELGFISSVSTGDFAARALVKASPTQLQLIVTTFHSITRRWTNKLIFFASPHSKLVRNSALLPRCRLWTLNLSPTFTRHSFKNPSRSLKNVSYSKFVHKSVAFIFVSRTFSAFSAVICVLIIFSPSSHYFFFFSCLDLLWNFFVYKYFSLSLAKQLLWCGLFSL